LQTHYRWQEKRLQLNVENWRSCALLFTHAAHVCRHLFSVRKPPSERCCSSSWRRSRSINSRVMPAAPKASLTSSTV
jgi:hypothetical protein